MGTEPAAFSFTEQSKENAPDIESGAVELAGRNYMRCKSDLAELLVSPSRRGRARGRKRRGSCHLSAYSGGWSRFGDHRSPVRWFASHGPRGVGGGRWE